MFGMLRLQSSPHVCFASIFFLGAIVPVRAWDSKVMGEVQFDGATKVEKDSGVWVDGGYVGYLKELKGDKKVLLLPGEHEIVVRQSGYNDFSQKIVVEPGQTQSGRGGCDDALVAARGDSGDYRNVESDRAAGTRRGVSGWQIRGTRQRVRRRHALDANQSGKTSDQGWNCRAIGPSLKRK